MGEPNPMRWVVLSIVAGGLFTIGIILFVDHVKDTAMAQAQAEVAATVDRMEKNGTPLLDEASATAVPFIAHVGAGRFAAAHALLAAPYRGSTSVAAFAASCRASPILAGAGEVTLRELRQQSAGGASTLEARGVLASRAGAVPIAITFLREADGPRILVVSLAGVPALQGVSPRP